MRLTLAGARTITKQRLSLRAPRSLTGGRVAEVGVANGVDASYDAQRNEFCAYVLSEAETPFGLTLGNFKTFATSTPKGGIRGLWDADTDQIIFGSHQIAYRAGNGPTLFPQQITRELTFLPYAQIAEFELDERPARHRGVLRSARSQARSRRSSFVVDVTIHNPGRPAPRSVRVFPWALLVGQRFYGEPEKAGAARVVEADFIRSYGEESGYARWWGGSRAPAAVVVALREQRCWRRCATARWRRPEHLDEVTPKLAEFVNRRIFGAFEYDIRRRRRSAREPAPRGRLPQGRRRVVEAGPANSCSATTRRSTKRSATTPPTSPTRV